MFIVLLLWDLIFHNEMKNKLNKNQTIALKTHVCINYIRSILHFNLNIIMFLEIHIFIILFNNT